MDYICKIGSCSFNSAANQSAGYILKFGGYSQTNTDTVITDYSGDSLNASIASPSNLAPATLWSVPNYLHFVNTSKGAWINSDTVFADYKNDLGHSLLISMKIKVPSAPTGVDTFFLGNATANTDSIGLRVRQVGTSNPTGGDGRVVLAAYKVGAGPYGPNSLANICDNQEHTLTVLLDRTSNEIVFYLDGVMNYTAAFPPELYNSTFRNGGLFGVGCSGNVGVLQAALTCDIRDFHMVYTPNKCQARSKIDRLANKLHVQPYSTITSSDWGF